MTTNRMYAGPRTPAKDAAWAQLTAAIDACLAAGLVPSIQFVTYWRSGASGRELWTDGTRRLMDTYIAAIDTWNAAQGFPLAA